MDKKQSYIEQVDILIFKNQVLQNYTLYIMHIKLHKLPWIEIHENFIPTKSKNHIVYSNRYITVINTNIPYNWPAGS